MRARHENAGPTANPSGTRRLATEQYADSSNLAARIRLHQYSTAPRRWPAWLFDQLDLPPRARILEIGCGSGSFWAENADRVPPGWDLTLSDFSGGMLAETRRTLSPVPRAFRFLRCNAEALPFASGTFDAVLAFHMLYHVPDRARALADVRRVLRPGGRLLATTNGSRHLLELNDLRRRFAPDVEHPPQKMLAPFTLENGGAQIESVFGSVEKRVLDDALAVPEAEAIVGFLLSLPGNAREVLRGARLDALHRDLREEIVRQGGAIHIGKESGLFIARAGLGQ